MTRLTQTILAVIVIVAVAIGVVFWLKSEPLVKTENTDFNQGGDIQTSTSTSTVSGQGNVISSSSLSYANAKYGFSLNYPSGYTTREMPIDSFDIITIEGRDSSKGLQIAITSYDKNILTPSDVSAIATGLKISNAKEITVDGKGQGFLFNTDDPAFGGASIEAWFVVPASVGHAKDGLTHIYQVSSFAENESFVRDVLSTMKF